MTEIDCHWISIVHLRELYSLDKSRRSTLVFTNGYELTLDVSIKSIRNQGNRTKVILRRKQSSHYELFTNALLGFNYFRKAG